MNDELLVPMTAMYKAGKITIPNQASQTATVSNNLYDAMEAFNLQSAYAGDPALMTDMLKIGGEVYNQLRAAAVSLENAASAVIATANAFRDTDSQARHDYNNLSSGLKNHHVDTPYVDPKLPDLTKDGGATYTPDRPYGHGGIQTPPPVHVAPTTAPESPTTDKSSRDAGVTTTRDGNPIPTLPDGER